MTALVGLYQREMGRIFSGSGVTLALPAALAWIGWQRLYGGVNLGGADPVDDAFKACALLLAPLAVWVCAPSLAGERASGTASLWAISPVRPLAVLGGKFLAVMSFLAVAAVMLLAPTAWEMAALGSALWVRLGAGVLGLLLLCGLAAAVTLLASALVKHFSTAFAIGAGALSLWMWGTDLLRRVAEAVSSLLPTAWGSHLTGAFDPVLGWNGRALLYPLFVGWVDLGAIAAMAGLTILALVLTHQLVASERWRG